MTEKSGWKQFWGTVEGMGNALSQAGVSPEDSARNKISQYQFDIEQQNAQRKFEAEQEMLQRQLATQRMKMMQDESQFRRQQELELYLKSQPATYTYTDPATGEAKSYSVASNLSPEIQEAAQRAIAKRFGGVVPQGVVPPQGLSLSQGQGQPSSPLQTSLPPGLAGIAQQGGKTQFIKGTGKPSPTDLTQSTVSKTGRFLQQFGRSYNELKEAYPEIGEKGFTGWATRKGASLGTMLDQFPETKAFQSELLPLANESAKDVEGAKITDNDRKIYANAFANTLSNPSQTNIRLVSNSLLKMKDKGGNIDKVLIELYSSDVDLFPKIANEVMKDDKELKQRVLTAIYQQNPDRFEVVQ